MTTRTESKPWDLSHVLDLVNSLSTKDLADNPQPHEVLLASPPLNGRNGGNNPFDYVEHTDFATPPSQLGDFAKIWQYLGAPFDSPAPEVPPLTNEPATTNTSLPTKDDYASDGATYFKSNKSGKEVQWQDQQSAEEPGTDTLTERSASPETPSLTKTQRKKQRRKERKAREAAEALKAATVSESEADTITRKTPARKASLHFVSSDAAKCQGTPEPRTPAKAAATPTPNAPTSAASIEVARARVAEKLGELKKATAESATPSKHVPSTPPPNRSGASKQQSHSSSVPAIQRTTSAQNAIHSRPNGQPQWPVSRSSNAQAVQKALPAKFLPSTVQPPSQSAAKSTKVSQPAAPVMKPDAPSTQPKHVIEPKIVRSGEDRHWALLMKLIGDFWEDRKYIISPMNLTTHNNDPKGIHVFVDASNIFIGFNDQLKRSRGIPQWAHVPHVDLSFDALALLMERRRPVAKRVLVGSTPHMPAFDKAKAVGYECSILEKVYKARELTERQIYFKEHDRYGNYRKGAKAPPANSVGLVSGSSSSTNGNANSGYGSGSETSAPQYAPPRMIEQGVDEIVHLKILESVVDTDTPSTIVLATGDAAQAEYSQGFMAMVERALKKGWKVELVSWSKNVSMLYRRREWAEAWGANFRVIYLDDYAEELLDM